MTLNLSLSSPATAAHRKPWSVLSFGTYISASHLLWVSAQPCPFHYSANRQMQVLGRNNGPDAKYFVT